MKLEVDNPDYLKNSLKTVLLIFLGLLFFWSTLRLYLYVTHLESFSDLSLRLRFLSFLGGVRYDISTVFYTNIIFFLLLYSKNIRSSYLFRGLFILINSCLGLLHMMDTEYFGVVGRRLDRSFLSVAKETKVNSYSALFSEYGYMLIAFLLFTVYMFFLSKVLKRREKKFYLPLTFHIGKYLQYFFILACFTLVGVRGGFQKKPLALVHAYVLAEGKGSAANLSLNTAYNFIRSKAKNPFPEKYRNFKGPFFTDEVFTNTDIALNKEKPKNVLILFVESFSTYSVEKNKTSFIKELSDKHPKEAIFIKDHFSNGRFSMDALTSVFLGVPSFFDLFLFKSNFAQNKWIGLASVLGENNFNTFFIHAAEPGTMYFDRIAPAVGFKNFYSLGGLDKKTPEEMMAPWGVHDEYMYKKSVPILDKYAGDQDKPFMGVLFSVSSHTPFVNPPGDESKREDAVSNYLKTIRYAEDSLEVFFESIKDKPWFKDTLFIVTGDHSPPVKASWLKEAKDKSRVPLMLYYPESNIGELDRSHYSQHLDLPSTIFDLLKISPTKWSPYGKSIFNTKARRLIGYYWDQSFNFVEGECLVNMSVLTDDIKTAEARLEEADCKDVPDENQVREYNDFIKSYVNRLEKNQIYK